MHDYRAQIMKSRCEKDHMGNYNTNIGKEV